MKKHIFIKSMKFRAETTNPLAAIESARVDVERNVQKLTDGMNITRGGAVSNPKSSSIGNTDNSGLSIKSEKFGVSQWYEEDLALYNAEVEAMNKFFPQAKEGKLPDGRMTWTVTIQNIADVEGNDWTFMLVYDTDHPSNSANANESSYSSRWAGSVKIYPVRPNATEIKQAAKKAGRGDVPHLLLDSYGNVYLDTFQHEDFEAGRVVTSGVSVLGQAMRWATAFTTGLKSQAVWDIFKQHSDQF